MSYNWHYLAQLQRYGEVTVLGLYKLNAENVVNYQSLPNPASISQFTIGEKLRLELQYKCYMNVEDCTYNYYSPSKLYLDFVQDCRTIKLNAALFNNAFGYPCNKPINSGWQLTFSSNMLTNVWIEMKYFGDNISTNKYRNYKVWVKIIDDYTVYFRFEFYLTFDMLDFLNNQQITNNDRYFKRGYNDVEQLQVESTYKDTVYDYHKYISIVVENEFLLEIPTCELLELSPSLRPKVELIRGIYIENIKAQWYNESTEIINPIWTALDGAMNSKEWNLTSNEYTNIKLQFELNSSLGTNGLAGYIAIIRTDTQNDDIDFISNYEEVRACFNETIISGAKIFPYYMFINITNTTHLGSNIYEIVTTIDNLYLKNAAKYRFLAVIYRYNDSLWEIIDLVTFLSEEIQVDDVKGIGNDLQDEGCISGKITDYTQETTTNYIQGIEAGERLQNTIEFDIAGTTLSDIIAMRLGVVENKYIWDYIKDISVKIYSERNVLGNIMEIVYLRDKLVFGADGQPILNNNFGIELESYIGGHKLKVWYKWRTTFNASLPPLEVNVLQSNNFVIRSKSNNILLYNMNMEGKEVNIEFAFNLKYPENSYLSNELIVLTQKVRLNTRDNNLNINSNNIYYASACCNYTDSLEVRHPVYNPNQRLVLALLQTSKGNLYEYNASLGKLPQLQQGNLIITNDEVIEGSEAVSRLEYEFDDDIETLTDIIIISKEK